MAKRLLTIVGTAVCMLPAVMQAADAGLSFQGDGTQESPWQIASVSDVMELANACNGDGTLTGPNCSHYQGKYFVLTKDIDMAGITGFYGIATAPKGQVPAVSFKFQGNFDGQGHKVKNMVITGVDFDDTGKATSSSKTGSRKYVGFFGTVEGGVIKNLHIDATCAIEGWGVVGSIAGQTGAGTVIDNCTSAASLTAYDSDCGGITGYANGGKASTPVEITNCSFSGSIRMNYRYAGGIAGETNYAYIRSCSSTGSVELSAFNTYKGPGQQQYGGGLAGAMKQGSITDSFSATYLSNQGKYTGGITGCMGTTTSLSSASMTGCVSIGSVLSPDANTKGGLAGFAKVTAGGDAPFTVCYYDRDLWGTVAIGGTELTGGLPTSEFTSGVLPAGLNASGWTVQTGFYPRPAAFESEKAQQAASTYLVFEPGESAGDFRTSALISTAMPGITATVAEGSVFEVSGGKVVVKDNPRMASDTVTLLNGSYMLKIPVVKPPRAFEGDGTAENPYLINSEIDLINLADLSNADVPRFFEGVHFKLTADLDFTGITDFQGIACRNTGGYIGTTSVPPHYFAGHFDGGGHTVRNLAITGIVRNGEGNVVHYGTVGGSRMDVGFIGILYNGGSIKNLTLDSSCTVDGYLNVGGLVGFMGSGCSVENCVNGAPVTCYQSKAGGIVGYVYSSKIRDGMTVSGCVNYGTVKANDQYAGGIAGDSRGIISGCVNGGDVTVEYFDPCVSASTLFIYRAGGIAGGNTGDIIDCSNYGRVYTDSITSGGIAGYNSNGMSDSDKLRGGRIIRCLNAGSVGARILTMTGAIAGEDYHVTGTETQPVFTDCLYDSQYSGVLGAQGIDATGIVSLQTDSLASGISMEMLPGWSYEQNRYPVPPSVAPDGIARLISSVFLWMPVGETLNTFMAPARINTLVPIEASLATGEGFHIEEGMVKSLAVTELTQNVLTLSSGAYSRHLTLRTFPSVFEGGGTEENPYIIATVADFNKIGTFMEESGFDFEERVFLLTSDLDFHGLDAVSAGNSKIYFNGTFNGNGKCISGFALPAASNETDIADAGIFGGIGSKGYVRNLSVSDADISANLYGGIIAGHLLGKITGCNTDELCRVNVTTGKGTGLRPAKKGEYAGGIAGYMNYRAIIGNCVSAATVTGQKRVGGIVGGSDFEYGAMVTDCVNKGAVTAVAPPETVLVGGMPTSDYIPVMAGGIAGIMTGKILRCVNEGNVTTDKCSGAGGIAGQGFITLRVDSCLNSGTVSATWESAGGIVGITSNSSVENTGTWITDCTNSGTVSTPLGAGGITGLLNRGGHVLMCANTGCIQASGRSGGISGCTEGASEIMHCHNAGIVTGKGRAAAGLVGEVTVGGLEIKGCFNVGAVNVESANGTCGGLLNATAGPVSVTGSYNAGTVTAPKTVGGLGGSSTGCTYLQCYNAGEVYCTNAANAQSYAGNLSGNSAGTFTGCCYLDWLPQFPLDGNKGMSLSNSALINASELLGESYIYAPLALPRVDGCEDSDAAKAFSAFWVISGETAMDGLADPVQLCTMPGVEWKAEGALELSDGNAVPAYEGEGRLTVSCGDFHREFTFSCTTSSGIALDNIHEDGNVRWFRLSGEPVFKPAKGEMLIRVSGSNARKVIVQ